MHMSLTPCIRQEHRMELRIQVDAGVTLTVFPMSERWLREDSDHAWAVHKVKARSKPESFRSLMDYLFANVFIGTYWFVMDFYAEEAPPLREIISQEQCRMIDEVLIEALKLAYQDFCADRERSWSAIRRTSDARYLRAS